MIVRLVAHYWCVNNKLLLSFFSVSFGEIYINIKFIIFGKFWVTDNIILLLLYRIYKNII